MTTTNEPRPRISEGIRAHAIHQAAQAMQGAAYGRASVRKAELGVDALIELGWGPKPTVSKRKIAEWIVMACEGKPISAAHELGEYLHGLGIEVSE